MPTTDEAVAMLGRIWDARKLDYDVKLSVKGDRAGLEIFAPGSSERVAVYSPGDRWVFLDIPGVFTARYFEEGMTDADLLMWLERYLDAAIAYLQGRYVLHRSRRLRIPHVVIETSTGPVRLDLGPKALVRAVVTRGRGQ